MEIPLPAVPVSRAGKLEKGGDVDMFKFTVTTTTTLTVRTTGMIDTYGVLYNAAGTYMTESDDYTDLNFRIRRTFSPGTYYIAVDGYDATVTGSYTLQINP
jgi:Bacterial pre-peptidase C-terminal domain